jgi:xylulose-5-phosphate/fructose-6-phosphate phosphoketolase
LLPGHTEPERFHVRGFLEEGTTTTPFDMVVLNNMSRFHLAKLAVRRARRRPPRADAFVHLCDQKLAEHELYVREHLEDLPEVRDWVWTD